MQISNNITLQPPKNLINSKIENFQKLNESNYISNKSNTSKQLSFKGQSLPLKTSLTSYLKIMRYGKKVINDIERHKLNTDWFKKTFEKKYHPMLVTYTKDGSKVIIQKGKAGNLAYSIISKDKEYFILSKMNILTGYKQKIAIGVLIQKTRRVESKIDLTKEETKQVLIDVFKNLKTEKTK